MLFDTHLHLNILLQKLDKVPSNIDFNSPGFAQIKQEVLPFVDDLLKDHSWVVEIGVSQEDFITSYNILSTNPKIFFSYGIHPENVQSEDLKIETLLENFQDHLAKKKIVAIGECGLDYYYTQNPKIISLQKELFEKQIELAIAHKLPVIIHCRDAFDDLFEILAKYPQIHGKFVVHCFTGGPEEIARIVQYKGKVGLGGILTFPKNNEKLLEATKICPLENIVVETDLPFLAPVPFRGKVCLPEYIAYVFEKIAQIKDIPTPELITLTENNSRKLFDRILSQ